MPRPRKTAAAHKRDGSARKDRHKKTVEHTFAGGAPKMPTGLNSSQIQLWKVVCERIPHEYLGEIDTYALCMLVDAWKEWQRYRELVDNTEPTAKGFWNFICCKQSAAKTLDRMLSKFGATPRDRTMIKEIVAGDSDGDLSSIFESMFGNMN